MDRATTPGVGNDWRDVRLGFLVGAVSITLKFIDRAMPQWEVSSIEGIVPAAIFLVYILHRARSQPERLQHWGINAPLTRGSLVVFVLFLLLIVGLNVLGSVLLTGELEWHGKWVSDMVQYLPSAFAQQFALCSIGLAMLNTVPIFRGVWRLPIITGLLFSAAHFWTPAMIPGTSIPWQVMMTLPAGFGCAYYFLRFRSLLPLVVLHAVTFVLQNQWIENNL